MASKGYVDSLLNTLPTDLKRVLKPAFEHVMDTWRLGDDQKATNAAWYRYESTTAAIAYDEFSIVHGLNVAPTKLIPVLDLNTVNAQIVPLYTSRAADASRIYLRSGSTGAVFSFYLEA